MPAESLVEETGSHFYHELLNLPVGDRDRFDADEMPDVAVVAGGRHIRQLSCLSVTAYFMRGDCSSR
ncbi:hypothetical protein Htur_1252 [Haloterrigena turkmenica DSM 5511]|uniref:Uncharacterized protein n=1 Tax=Haloterrigena turkmenica (strain ATCC 51198 / DSM 5511 / JCM 9101 / NCIMB 13204 / VKM B-1734 / 4k) TaxID=543526 RepID=D2RPA8_HALTV|nr:hypothetical protein Htur_1252 [Haloterrigena turkmenica DSM 5511]